MLPLLLLPQQRKPDPIRQSIYLFPGHACTCTMESRIAAATPNDYSSYFWENNARTWPFDRECPSQVRASNTQYVEPRRRWSGAGWSQGLLGSPYKQGWPHQTPKESPLSHINWRPCSHDNLSYHDGVNASKCVQVAAQANSPVGH
jgi:hypothetical protein